MKFKTKKFEYLVYGERWHFHLCSDSTYTRHFGSDSEAICLLKDKEVWFKKTDYCPNVVAHELFHILMSQSNHQSSDLSGHQTEEVAAEIIGKSFDVLPHLVISIYTGLLR